MQRIIETSIEIASNQFKSYGFNDKQILSLTQSGKKDLTSELINLKELLEKDEINRLNIELSIHAIKGLLSTMGNKELAKKLSSTHDEEDDMIKVEEIKSILEL